MTPVELVLLKLKGTTKTASGWSARCPAHEDTRASLSVSEGADGVALLKCHAGCTPRAVVGAVGLTLRDLFPRAAAVLNTNEKAKPVSRCFSTARDAVAELERQNGTRSVLWTYTTAGGEPVGVVVRWDRDNGKDIRPVSRHPDGWRIGAMPDPRPLYNLPALADACVVLVVEGEKCADAARALGFTATTSAGGAQAPQKTDWSPLAGKEVWLLPDNDPPGRKYVETVTDLLTRLNPAPSVKVVELPGPAEGDDLVDWISARDGASNEVLKAELEALAGSVSPEAPAQQEEPLPFRPFPLHALPQPIRGFVAAGAKAIGCDLSYLVLPLLTALAAAIGNTRRLELKRGWYAPPILWAAIVGESGTAKTPAFKLVMRPARDRQRKALVRSAEETKQYDADLARWEKEYAAWKRSKSATDDPPPKPDPPCAERFIVSDTTVEALAPILMANPRGLLLARDELAGWLGSFDRYAGKGKAGADSANWLSMFNAESIIVDRKAGTPRTIHVPQAAVCVTGGIQPDTLRRALGAEHRESGLAARLLLACPPRKPKAWTEADIDPKAEAGLVALFDRLYELQPTEDDEGNAQPVLVRLDAPAKAAWTAYYDAHAAEQSDLTGDLSAAWSKLEEYAARLALVVHLTRWAARDPRLTNPNIVDAESMNAGIVLVKWFKREVRRVYAILDESDADRDRRRLAEWIERRGVPTTAREVQQGCRWLKEPGAAEAALEELVKHGGGSWRLSETTSHGGRPTRVFVPSTPSTVYETPSTHVEDEGSVDVDTMDATTAQPASEPELFPFGANNPDDPDGDRLFTNPEARGLPD